MRKIVGVAIGIVIAICVIVAGLLLYMHSSTKGKLSTTSNVPQSSAPSLEAIITNNIESMEKTHYVEISRGVSKMLIYVSKVNSNQSFFMNITLLINDVKAGLIRNSSMIVYYGHVNNITMLMNVMSSEGHHRMLMKMLDLDYLYIINLRNNSMKYCIKGKIIIMSGTYHNSTIINNCVTIPMKLAKMYQYTKSIDLAILKILSPILFRNVKYLGERNFYGEKCYMYELRNTIDIAKLMTNRTLISSIVKYISKIMPNSTKPINIEKIMNIARRLAMMLAITGLARWSIYSRFCITSTGYTPYLYAKITNTVKNMYNVTIIIMSSEVRKVEVGKVNTELLRSIESSITSRISRPTPMMLYMSYLPQTSLSPIMTMIAAMETTYFLTALTSIHTITTRKITTGTSSTSTWYKVSVTTDKLKLELKNGFSWSISNIAVVLVGEGGSQTKIEIICTTPLSPGSILHLTCVRGSTTCDVTVTGLGKCYATGSYTGMRAGTSSMVIVVVKLTNGAVRGLPPSKVIVTNG
ncbi:MAG: hypothetical protein GXO10_04145 [Crenarchaeota archaeon]|nr:hypothetical protein [Thermoproteota archaeon]